eukprot:CAMPEP_0206301942 /NCGR_PEP_ID=MMETSP0106_2-20121207/8470_1 /ASSEMBLY_ACC=CAM_ASM_000206 /TAXON_ID=81532 /ORGANISM="Acanthoeca-like sp., Strain 10tr" /LENGTH=68 /DNA_ID=CAMNT_0053732699 /DNA_START=117 /DNA_END=323 /DNA_ORIENTATION=-
MLPISALTVGLYPFLKAHRSRIPEYLAVSQSLALSARSLLGDTHSTTWKERGSGEMGRVEAVLRWSLE